MEKNRNDRDYCRLLILFIHEASVFRLVCKRLAAKWQKTHKLHAAFLGH